MGLPAHLIEKDFWVCFTLKILFSLEDHGENLTFKGGTSLSKAYHAIERFSEDIDFAISRQSLGFGGDNAPDANSISGVQRERRLENLGQACQSMVETKLFPAFEKRLREVLTGTDWSIEFKAQEKRNQVINFRYPKSSATLETAYNPPMVRIEMTARTDNHPSNIKTIQAHAAEHFPEMFKDRRIEVSVLAVERTFWEKATILHQLHYCENAAYIQTAHSRHYYDIHRLDLGGFTTSAIDQIDLLPEVADHKKLFYRQAWARYDLARNPKTLQLLPHQNIAGAIEQDYEDMREMIFGDVPSFEKLISQLEQLQETINRR